MKNFSRRDSLQSSILCALCIAATGTQATGAKDVQVMSQAPQFGIYASSMPDHYTPPPGIVVLPSWHTLIKLDPWQQRRLGADLAAKVTYYPGCDAFDRIESIVYLTMPRGTQPTSRDLSREIEMARFMTPFSTYNYSSTGSYVFPLMDIRLFAAHLSDPTSDVWVGFRGGSNPTYANGPGTYNPCWDGQGRQVSTIPSAGYPAGLTKEQGQAIFARTGFSFSLDLVSTEPPLPPPRHEIISARLSPPSVPTDASWSGHTLTIDGSLEVPKPFHGRSPVSGTLQVIVTSHGGDSEYGFNTGNTLWINGKRIGAAFSTQANCTTFADAAINPLNPDINSETTGNAPDNPRNWCPAGPVRTTADNPGTTYPTPAAPGVPVKTQIFEHVMLHSGRNDLKLDIGPFVTVFGGPYRAGSDDYPLSINFIPD